ncbi:MAG: phenylphosphate carboxylase subunit gamma [Dehalococcoidia bacterium]
MMKREYVTWVDDLHNLPEGEEIQLTIRDLTPGRRKYEARHVKAILSSSPDKLPDGDTLWLRSGSGVMMPVPWVIRVVEELGDYLPGTPYQEMLLP